MATVTRNVLPTSVRPTHYALDITPDIKQRTFDGVVSITFNAKDASSITLNSVDLTYRSVSISYGGATIDVAMASLVWDTANETVTVPVGAPLNGTGVLTISYVGIINEKMHGFYLSTVKRDAEVSYLGVTQFEAADARRALPCWDEPAQKATFKVTITCLQEFQAWSNTEAESVGPADGKPGYTTSVFGTTPKMSTYLLAWLVGRMELIERSIPKRRGGTTSVRVLTPPGRIQQATFALDVACKVLPFYEDVFGSDYILSKCDLAAIPDFAAGAMENWGLITFRETALLCDDTSSITHRRWVALVVAHELAHQWFGNLVTMEWWKELWLNESFATWIEYWAVDCIFPSWDIFSQFVGDETMRAFALDGRRSSHPVEVDVVNAREIDQIFDAISYSKGGSLLRMVINTIGIPAFKAGISAYLKHFAFGNASTVELWKFLGEAAGKDLPRMLRDWTSAQGYPYVSATRSADGSTLTLRQHRFLDTGDVTPDEDKTVWYIPLRTVDSNGTLATIELVERESTVAVSSTATWIKLNHEVTAFCRVYYAGAMFDALVAALRSGALKNPLDRLSIAADYHAMARAGVLPTSDALTLLSAFSNEDRYEVWMEVLALESNILAIVESTAPTHADTLKRQTIQLCKPALVRLGYQNQPSESEQASQLRALLLSRLSSYGDADSKQVLLDLFDQRATTPIPSDLRGGVYAAVVRYRGTEGYNAILSMALHDDDAMERARALRALPSVADQTLLDSALTKVLDGTIRSQDSVYLLFGAASCMPASARFISFLTRNWSTIEAKLPGMLLGRVVKVVDQMWHREHIKTLESWWSTTSAATKNANGRSFEQGMEGLRSNVAWAERDSAIVVKRLASA